MKGLGGFSAEANYPLASDAPRERTALEAGLGHLTELCSRLYRANEEIHRIRNLIWGIGPDKPPSTLKEVGPVPGNYAAVISELAQAVANLENNITNLNGPR